MEPMLDSHPAPRPGPPGSSSSLSRRRFLAASSSAMLGGTLVRAAESGSSAGSSNKLALALEGGPKSVAQRFKAGPRWGDPEREQLKQTLEQDTLFYWKGPRTTLLLEKFRKICPVQHAMTCSSGTAALHIAV